MSQKKNKPLKIKNKKSYLEKNINEQDTIVLETSNENYEELLGLFEKIDKTDGLINKNLKLSERTILTIDKW